VVRPSWLMTRVTVLLLTSIPAILMFVSPSKKFVRSVPGSPVPDPRLPILCLQAHEYRSRPRMLSGMDDEGGELIYVQAHGLRVGRLPQVLSPSSPFIPYPWLSLGNRTFKVGLAPHLSLPTSRSAAIGEGRNPTRRLFRQRQITQDCACTTTIRLWVIFSYTLEAI